MGPYRKPVLINWTKKYGRCWCKLLTIMCLTFAALIEPFRFIPNWRIDDVMVSYATKGGGVGPHFDQYDVFLVQGLGTRLWQIGKNCNQRTPLLPNQGLKLLADFSPADEWNCEPGDILYIPPGLSHNGIATSDDCMTYSIGFRAPSSSELIGYWADDILVELTDDDRYRDVHTKARSNSGEITSQEIDTLHKMITEKIDDQEAFARWFGQFNSTPKYPDMDWQPDAVLDAAQIKEMLANQPSITRNPASRFSYIEHSENHVSLFVDGQLFDCTEEVAIFAKSLTSDDPVVIALGHSQSDAVNALLQALHQQGSFFFN